MSDSYRLVIQVRLENSTHSTTGGVRITETCEIEVPSLLEGSEILADVVKALKAKRSW